MRPGSLALLGVAAYSAFLVATMPARWVAERVLPPGPRSYALQEIDGTIWSGSARAAFGSVVGTFMVDRLQWRFLPARLLQGRVAYQVQAAGSGIKASGEVGRGFGGWEVQLGAAIDAAIVTTPWRPEGLVNVDIPGMTLSEQNARGKAQVEWRNAASAMSDVRPLGSYRAEIEAEGATARIDVSTLSGPLRVTGKGTLALPAQLTLNGEARVDGPQAAALQPLLDLMGPRRADGAHAIAWRTR